MSNFDDILGNIRRGVNDYQQLRAVELALDRKLIRADQLQGARDSGRPPLDFLVEEKTLTRKSADELLRDLDVQDSDRFASRRNRCRALS